MAVQWCFELPLQASVVTPSTKINGLDCNLDLAQGHLTQGTACVGGLSSVR